MRFVFLNTTIVTVDGFFSVRTVSLDDVKTLLKEDRASRLSAVGHAATAQIMSELLGEEVKENRIQYAQQEEDIAICFKLKGRIPEGQILTREQIEAIGFEFKVMTLHNDNDIQMR
jgi:hypothetical protein